MLDSSLSYTLCKHTPSVKELVVYDSTRDKCIPKSVGATAHPCVIPLRIVGATAHPCVIPLRILRVLEVALS